MISDTLGSDCKERIDRCFNISSIKLGSYVVGRHITCAPVIPFGHIEKFSLNLSISSSGTHLNLRHP